eukprot:TRINITY_DN44683_c0_g1_i2.p3 TRINITY_DN44683_c0_g1~~TRINITY_DN44683_c0_g1_i2.p3  ORF type:complete len:127 (-),score=42.24 TRINITY_DN44683_c0_g1_i2:213-593(-)
MCIRDSQGCSCLAVALMATHCCFGNLRGLGAADKLQMRGLLLRGMGVLGVGFCALWLPEHFYCGSYPEQLQPLRLHALFHLACAFGTYSMIQFVQFYIYERSQLKPVVQYTWMIPSVTPQVKHFKK